MTSKLDRGRVRLLMMGNEFVFRPRRARALQAGVGWRTCITALPSNPFVKRQLVRSYPIKDIYSSLTALERLNE